MSDANTAKQWEQRAQALTFKTRPFINGRYVKTQTGKDFESISPINGNPLARVSLCEQVDIDFAVKTSRHAFEDGRWSKRAPQERKDILLKFSMLIEDNIEDLALLETLETGKTIAIGLSHDVKKSAETIRWYAETLDKIGGEIVSSSDGMLSTVEREPVGVVGCISAWNWPLWNASLKFAPALAMGNSVILKPAEQASLSCLRVAALAKEAGIPDGVFNIVTGNGETTGQAMALHPDIDTISFTGSSETGKRIFISSGQSNMKQVWVECGGKSPNIVMPDYKDLDTAAQQTALIAFAHGGQFCVAGTRVFAHADIHDIFVEKLVAATAGFAPGNPFDPSKFTGSIISEAQLERIKDYVKIGKQAGYTLACGGNTTREETGGYYFEPTVFTGVANTSKIAQDEIFGPVICVIKFTDTKEMIKQANQSRYGLSAYLWTNDLTSAHTISSQLHVGTVNINNVTGGSIAVPMGGYKQSGNGKDNALHALEKYSQLKAKNINYS